MRFCIWITTPGLRFWTGVCVYSAMREMSRSERARFALG